MRRGRALASQLAAAAILVAGPVLASGDGQPEEKKTVASSRGAQEPSEPALGTEAIWQRRWAVLHGTWKGTATRQGAPLEVEIHVFFEGASDPCLRFDVATKNLWTRFHICDRFREEAADQTVFDPSRKPYNLYASARGVSRAPHLPGLGAREARVKAVLQGDTLSLDITAKGSGSPEFKVLLRKVKD